MVCAVCNHPEREAIEQELLLRNFGDTDFTFRKLSDTYGVTVNELKIHALMHMSVNYDESIVDRIKLKEAGYLRSVAEENFATMKNLGVQLNRIISANKSDDYSLKQITKSTVDLYLGCSQAIQSAVESLSKLNISINGDKNTGLEALGELVKAIKGEPSGD